MLYWGEHMLSVVTIDWHLSVLFLLWFWSKLYSGSMIWQTQSQCFGCANTCSCIHLVLGCIFSTCWLFMNFLGCVLCCGFGKSKSGVGISNVVLCFVFDCLLCATVCSVKIYGYLYVFIFFMYANFDYIFSCTCTLFFINKRVGNSIQSFMFVITLQHLFHQLNGSQSKSGGSESSSYLCWKGN